MVSFLSTQCPISNSYLPELNDLSSTYRRRGVEFYGVISDPAVTRAEALEHSQTYRIRFPVLFDGSGELRLALSPTHTPQAFVLNQFGKTLYSGAIDDRHVKLGQKKEAATRRVLRRRYQGCDRRQTDCRSRRPRQSAACWRIHPTRPNPAVLPSRVISLPSFRQTARPATAPISRDLSRC